MSKTELPLTPERLLADIRAGALKEEIIRTYRTTEAELAGTLSMLYRTGEIAKDEFNEFFKGVSVKKDSTPSTGPSRAEEAPDAPALGKDRDQPAAPSRLSLAALFSLISGETVPEKSGRTETVEPRGVPAGGEAVSPPDTSRELSVQKAFGTTADGDARVSIPELELRDEVIQAPPSDVTDQSLPSDNQTAAQDIYPLLEKILTRLNVIEKRLAAMEQELNNP